MPKKSRAMNPRFFMAGHDGNIVRATRLEEIAAK